MLDAKTLAMYMMSTPTYVRRYLNDYMENAFTDQQLELLSILDARNMKGNPAYNKVAIVMPRGYRKTSTVQAYVAKCICTRAANFIPYISSSESLAVIQTEAIKGMLLMSKNIREDFGKINAPSGDSIVCGDLSLPFTKESWVARFPDDADDYLGCMVLPRGSRQTIRGWKFFHYRPDLLVFDDIESKTGNNSVNNEEIRKAIYDWFLADAMQVISQEEQASDDRKYQIIYIGTLLHQDSLLVKVMEDPTWKVLNYPACDAEYKSLMPTVKSDEAIMRLVTEHRTNGKLDVFYREFMNTPIPAEGAAFDSTMFKPLPAGVTHKTQNVETVILCDFAKSTTPQSDWTAILAVGVSMKENAIYVWDIQAGHFHPDDSYQTALNMADQYGTHTIGREVTGLNEFVTYPFDTFVKSKGRYIEMIDLKARGRKKEDRIKSLIPLYRQGWVYHNKAKCGDLEAQLMTFPVSRRDDIMDGLAYVVEMLDVGGRFFSQIRPGNDKSAEEGLDYEAQMLRDLDATEEDSEMYDYAEI